MKNGYVAFIICLAFDTHDAELIIVIRCTDTNITADLSFVIINKINNFTNIICVKCVRNQ